MGVDELRLNFQGESLWLLNAIIGLIIFGVALDLRWRDFVVVAQMPRAPLIGLVAQFFLLPAFTFLLTLLLNPQPSIALGMILVASCPGGNLSNFLTHLARGNTALSVTMTAVSTAAAVVMTPLNVWFWGRLNPATASILTQIHLDPVDLFLAILLILGVPLTLGMSCTHYLPVVARRLHVPLKYLSIFFFMGFVTIVFWQNREVFARYIGWVALAVFLHNGLALSLGYGMGRFARLSARDARAISIEVGIQNSALALLIIFDFFGGMGGMALTAGWWGIWHILSGLTLASAWALRPPIAPGGGGAE